MAEGNSIPAKLQRMLNDSDFESALEFLTGTYVTSPRVAAYFLARTCAESRTAARLFVVLLAKTGSTTTIKATPVK